jgi:hypothetical protein
MIKIVDSYKLELFLFFNSMLSIAFGFGGPRWIAFSIVMIITLYFCRMLTSLKHWRISKGIAMFNFSLNLQIINVVLAIGFIVNKYEGYSLMTYNAITGFKILTVLVGLVLVFRWGRINTNLYFKLSKYNIAKAFVGTFICYFLFYILDMSRDFD